MSTGQAPPVVHDGDGVRTHIFLQPIASPGVLGYFAGATGLLLFGVFLTGNLGGAKNAAAEFPFILLFAGFGQLTAALWALKARDATLLSLFGTWGGFWIGYGLLWLLDVTGDLTVPSFHAAFPALGMWFIMMAAITLPIAFAALGRSPAQFVSIGLVVVASAMIAASLKAGAPYIWTQVAGWIFISASAGYFYHSMAQMLNATFERTVLPQFTWRRDENVPGAQPIQPISFADSEPGVKVGQ